MSEEKTGGQDLPIIKNDEFSLTEQDVAIILKETQKDLKATIRALNKNPTGNEKNFLESHLKSVKTHLEVLSAPWEIVLARTKHFYDRTTQLGNQGFNEEAMLDQLVDEFSDIDSYYGLIRKQSWGYRLGQGIYAKRVQQQIEKKK